MNKKTITFAICDDEELFLDKAEKMLYERFDEDKSLHFEIECLKFRCSEELFASGRLEDIDIAVLDIEIGSDSGFDLAKKLVKINSETGIIFITSHNDYVYNSFICRPLGFIRKNQMEEDSRIVISNITEFLCSKYIIYEFGMGIEKVSINLSELRYIELFGHNIHLGTGSKPILCRDTLSRFESDLLNNGFIKVNRGTLINKGFIDRIDSENVILIDNTIHKISRGQKKNIMTMAKTTGLL